MASLDDLYRQRWGCVNPMIPYAPETAIAAYWRAHPELGSPVGFEEKLDSGGVGQAFTNGIVRWSPETGAVLVSE